MLLIDIFLKIDWKGKSLVNCGIGPSFVQGSPIENEMLHWLEECVVGFSRFHQEPDEILKEIN